MTTTLTFLNFARNIPHVVKYAIHIWNIYHIMCLSSLPLEGAEQIQVLTHIARLVPDLRLALKYFTSRHTCPPSFSNQIYYILKMIWDIILRIRIVYTSLRSRSLFLTRFMTFSWNQEKIHNPRWRRKGISPFCLAAECFHGWWLWSHLNELHPPQHNPFFFLYSQFSWTFGRPRFSNKLFFSFMTFNYFPKHWFIKLTYLKW